MTGRSGLASSCQSCLVVRTLSSNKSDIGLHERAELVELGDRVREIRKLSPSDADMRENHSRNPSGGLLLLAA